MGSWKQLVIVAVAVIVLALLVRLVLRTLAQAGQRRVQKAVRAGNLRLAGDLLIQDGDFLEAARYYVQAGEHLRAARALLRCNDEIGAAQAYVKAGETAKAAELFAKHGKHVRAADLFSRCDGPDERRRAADEFLLAGRPEKAAKIYQALGELELAADAYGKVDDLEPRDVVVTLLETGAIRLDRDDPRRRELLERAAHAAYRLGLHDRAAAAFDAAGLGKNAAKLYEALKRYDVASAIMDELGEEEEARRLRVAAGGELPVLVVKERRARERGDASAAERLETAVVEARAREEVETVATASTAVMGSGGGGRHDTMNPDRRYELLGELGRGGMGVVYRARDLLLQREVALKFLPEGLDPTSQMVALFRREARACAALSHPGIVIIHDLGRQGNREFIAMELVAGTPMDDVLAERGRLPVREALNLMEQVLDAVAFAHEHKIIHRDLKPANLMLLADGRVKVMDFGLAKLVTGTTEKHKQTMIAGTPAYMPPEQLKGTTDPRSDVFALGATFYEMLVGQPPGDIDRPAYLSEEYPSPHDMIPAVPARLSDAIMRCLRHKRMERVQTVAELRAEVKAVALEIDARLKAFLDTGPEHTRGV